MVILDVDKAQLKGDPSQLLPSSFIVPPGDKDPAQAERKMKI